MELYDENHLMVGVISSQLTSNISQAGEANIVQVKVESEQTCSFSVTFENADDGLDHYANKWDVMTMDGKVFKSRVLYLRM
ncbi:MAG: hypothetical protein ACI9JR_000233 [Gammaproteobacteria bacterium]